MSEWCSKQSLQHYWPPVNVNQNLADHAGPLSCVIAAVSKMSSTKVGSRRLCQLCASWSSVEIPELSTLLGASK